MTGTNKRRQRGVAALAVTAAVATLGLAVPAGTAAAGPSPLVDDDGAQCKEATFTTIQAAVDAASPGAKISVCAGTYAEQVTIPAGKDRLTLESKSRWTAVIQAPPALVGSRAIVRVAGALAVTIRDFTIAGPGGAQCGSLRAGVLVDAGGSASILRNHIVDIREEPLTLCDFGNGVQVGGLGAGPGAAIVKENVVERYQKTGIQVLETGSVALVENNDVIGVGPTDTLYQSGIQISDGAVVSVKRNRVSGNVFVDQDFSSIGILVQATAGVEVDHNTLSGNDVGVYVADVTGAVTVRGNKVSFSTFDGIAVAESTGVVVIENRSTDNGSPTAKFVGAGIGVYTTTASRFERNLAERNSGSGLFLEADTADNLIGKHDFKNNAQYDCEDKSVGAGTSRTANTWPGQYGRTENRPGLCTKAQAPVAEPSSQRMPAPAPPDEVSTASQQLPAPAAADEMTSASHQPPPPGA